MYSYNTYLLADFLVAFVNMVITQRTFHETRVHDEFSFKKSSLTVINFTDAYLWYFLKELSFAFLFSLFFSYLMRLKSKKRWSFPPTPFLGSLSLLLLARCRSTCLSSSIASHDVKLRSMNIPLSLWFVCFTEVLYWKFKMSSKTTLLSFFFIIVR